MPERETAQSGINSQVLRQHYNLRAEGLASAIQTVQKRAEDGLANRYLKIGSSQGPKALNWQSVTGIERLRRVTQAAKARKEFPDLSVSVLDKGLDNFRADFA